MTYTYDVFLSYSRRNPVLPWVRDYFKPLLEEWLPQSMPSQPEIFRDEESIETGESWPYKLQQGLLKSKIVVAVLSPSYFRSPWCMAEWASIRQREIGLGLRTPAVPGGLLYPVCFHDGEHFSQDARDIQHKDLRKWNRASPAFPQTADYHDFIGEMQIIALEIAALIASAPAWRSDFPILTPPGDSVPPTDLPRLL